MFVPKMLTSWKFKSASQTDWNIWFGDSIRLSNWVWCAVLNGFKCKNLNFYINSVLYFLHFLRPFKNRLGWDLNLMVSKKKNWWEWMFSSFSSVISKLNNFSRITNLPKLNPDSNIVKKLSTQLCSTDLTFNFCIKFSENDWKIPDYPVNWSKQRKELAEINFSKKEGFWGRKLQKIY